MTDRHDSFLLGKVTEVCSENGVSPVAAVVVGSQAMGVATPDSDTDIRFVFKNSLSDYVGRGNTTSDINKSSGNVDLAGWDVEKFTSLLADSDPNAVEMCLSRQKLLDTETGAFDRLASVAAENANLMALYHHYLSLARSNYSKYFEKENDVTYARLFHVLRGLVAAQHIRIHSETPPLDAFRLADSVETKASVLFEDVCDIKIEPTAGGEIPENNYQVANKTGTLIRMEPGDEVEATDRRTRMVPEEELNKFIESCF